MPVFPSYRNQSIYLHCESVDWFLYEGNTDTWCVQKTKILVVRSENFFVNHEWRPTNSSAVIYLSRKQIFAYYCFSLNMDIQEALDVYLYNLGIFLLVLYIYFELMLSASCNILIENRNSIHLVKQLSSRYFQCFYCYLWTGFIIYCYIFIVKVNAS